MREFIRRALQKTSRMNGDQMQGLLSLIAEEYETLDAVLDSLSNGNYRLRFIPYYYSEQ